MNEFQGQPGIERKAPLAHGPDQPLAGLSKPLEARFWGLRRVALATVASDVVAIALAFVLAALLANLVRLGIGVETVQAWEFLVRRAPDLALLTVLMIGLFSFSGLYGRGGWEVEEIRRIVFGVALIALFDTALYYITKTHSSRLWFLAAWPLAAILIIGMRMALRAVPWVERAMTTSVILLGNGISSELFLHDSRESRSGPVRLLAQLSLSAVGPADGDDLASRLRDLASARNLRPGQIQIVIAPAPGEREAAQGLMDHFNRIAQPYSVVLPYHGLAQSGLRLHNVVGADTVLAEVSQDIHSGVQRVLKRTLDLVFSGLLMILIAPLLLTLSGLLMLEGGPVFFSQLRIGENLRRFRCLKFRSMRPDAEQRLSEMLARDPVAREEWETHQKLKNDPRITPVGRFLRATSLDELPQLFNVLKGEMSMVGPRPIIAPEVPGYPSDRVYFESPEFIHYRRCKPGITGLWQVSGRAGTSHRERVRLDAWYARNWSIWLDLLILFKTVRVVIARTGS